MASELIYITGGVRSGKSRFAQEEAIRLAGPGGGVTFIATAGDPGDDPAWARRIEQHRAERPDHWQTIEASTRLDEALGSIAPHHTVVLIDCLTLWVGRMLGDASNSEGNVDESKLAEALRDGLAGLLKAIEAAQVFVIIVTNEVGSGVTPPTRTGNLFADALGEVNQQIAAISDRAYLLISGLPLRLR